VRENLASIIIVCPSDPRIHGFVLRGEPQADGTCIVDDPIAPGETLRLMPGEWRRA